MNMYAPLKTLLNRFGWPRSSKQIRRKAPSRTRLALEILEDRNVPTATASGVVSGAAFLDSNANGTFDADETALPGVAVLLTGTTTQNTPIEASAITDGNGAFQFLNVLPGDYQIQAGPVAALVDGVASIGSVSAPAGVNITGTETISKDLGVQGGLAPTHISLLLFLNTTTSFSAAFGAAGSGQALANYRPNSAPTVSLALGTVGVNAGAAPTKFDLAGHFTDPDITNSQVTFNITSNGEQHSLAVTLFDKTAPRTVANFFNYVESGRYDNSVFSRLVEDFVLQGGALALNGADDLTLINTQGQTVPNEFGASNKQGTLAMALSGNDINSATSQFFFNLEDNSGEPSELDLLKFTVFGQTANVDTLVSLLFNLGNTPTHDFSGDPIQASFPTVNLEDVPLNDFDPNTMTFPDDLTASNYMVIDNVTIDRRDEFLNYSVSVVVNNGPSNLVVATLIDEHLALSYPTALTGDATITVTATDRYGVSTSQTFNVNVF
jgi:peptidyl-prolyl cis-trans isomerase A (cyclophilin A)